MQRPPAISIQVVRSLRARRVVLASCGVLLAVPLICWWLGMPAVRVLALFAIWAVFTTWLLHYWRNSPQGRLRWDGELWHWSDYSEPLISVAIQYDFQTSVWLLLAPEKGRKFGVWLDACPLRMKEWHAIRRALVGAQDHGAGIDDPFASCTRSAS